MAKILNPRITLNTSSASDMVNVAVSYAVEFTTLERNLYQNGLRFRERIYLVARDYDDPALDADLWANGEWLPVPAMGSLTVPINRSFTVARSTLQEDPSGDTDEILCRIEIVPLEMPKQEVARTQVQNLPG
jgi:hypothetical protein